jgi:hypothetical protein
VAYEKLHLETVINEIEHYGVDRDFSAGLLIKVNKVQLME